MYSVSQILEHKWLAVRAIATGYVIWYVFNATLLRGVVRPVDLGMDDDAAAARRTSSSAYALWLGNGWIIAKLHRPYSTAMVLAYVLWAIVASVPPVYARRHEHARRLDRGRRSRGRWRRASATLCS